MQRDLECRCGSGHAREHERGRSRGKLGIPYEDDSISLLRQLGEAGCVTPRDEQKERACFKKPLRELLPAGATEDLIADLRVGAARHYVEVRGVFHLVTDLVERQPVEKAVADAVGIFVFYEGAEGREVTNQICEDYASVLCFG
jgi:hypothetical protein